jgi:DNA-directed RNA polymerase subunit RPC12/RpoP
MYKYNTLSQECSKCNKQVSLFSESLINIDQHYSYVCPYCGNQGTVKGSLGIGSNEIPNDAVPIKPE